MLDMEEQAAKQEKEDDYRKLMKFNPNLLVWHEQSSKYKHSEYRNKWENQTGEKKSKAKKLAWPRPARSCWKPRSKLPQKKNPHKANTVLTPPIPPSANLSLQSSFDSTPVSAAKPSNVQIRSRFGQPGYRGCLPPSSLLPFYPLPKSQENWCQSQPLPTELIDKWNLPVAHRTRQCDCTDAKIFML